MSFFSIKFSTGNGDPMIWVRPYDHQIVVNHNIYFDTALTLAQECERITNQEYTLKKNY